LFKTPEDLDVAASSARALAELQELPEDRLSRARTYMVMYGATREWWGCSQYFLKRSRWMD